MVRNTGDVDFSTIKLTDNLPKGLVIVNGTQEIDGVTKDYDVSNYSSPGLAKGQTRTFIFDAKATTEVACGVNRLTNIASIKPDALNPKSDNATVQICKPCDKSQTSTDLTSCIEYSKTATNVTQSIADANGTTANSNDVIKYTLTTKNSGNVAIKNYVVTENISDVLDYATVVDLHGGTIDANNIVTWPAKTLDGSQEFKNLITVKIKDPIPSTPISSSDPGHFDNKLTNVYGNTISINLPPSIVKTTEVITTTQLPNTGPGTTLTVGFGLVFMTAFFLFRSNLMRRELQMVQQDFSTTGGY